jgi:hypothetical protein
MPAFHDRSPAVVEWSRQTRNFKPYSQTTALLGVMLLLPALLLLLLSALLLLLLSALLLLLLSALLLPSGTPEKSGSCGGSRWAQPHAPMWNVADSSAQVCVQLHVVCCH